MRIDCQFPGLVGCSDYDDDIANLQSQVDALKQTVDVSTAEALKALQEAQAALQEDINELTAGKADAQAVKDLQEPWLHSKQPSQRTTSPKSAN